MPKVGFLDSWAYMMFNTCTVQVSSFDLDYMFIEGRLIFFAILDRFTYGWINWGYVSN